MKLNLKNLTIELPEEECDIEKMKETNRKLNKMKKFEQNLSEIYKEQIYISGKKVATDYKRLKGLNINSILNACGDYCDHRNAVGFNVKSLNIKDN